MTQEIIHYYKRQIQKLQVEIAAYPNEESLWKKVPSINNSAGNLCTHLIGNLNHFIGHAIGNTGYVRNRQMEFSIQNVPSAELIKQLDEASEMIETILSKVKDWNAPYPEELFGKAGSIHYFMLQLLVHFGYHLGQVNYHRRLLTT